MRVILALFALVVAGCGGGIDPEMGGTWTGPSSINWTGYPTYSWAGQLQISVSGASAEVRELCPDGSGSLVVTGAAEQANWTGSLGCNPVSVGQCNDVVFTFNNGAARLNPDRTLLVTGSGISAGCGTTIAFTASFNGSK